MVLITWADSAIVFPNFYEEVGRDVRDYSDKNNSSYTLKCSAFSELGTKHIKRLKLSFMLYMYVFNPPYKVFFLFVLL